MFASRIAKPEAKAADSPTRKLAPQRSTAVARPFGVWGKEAGGDRDQEAEPTLDRGAPRGLDWSLSKISILTPDAPPPAPPLSKPPAVILRPKLAIGSVDDPLEHEADRVAEQVMRMPEPDLSIRASPPQTSCKYAACDEDPQALQTNAAKPSQAVIGETPSIVHRALRSDSCVGATTRIQHHSEQATAGMEAAPASVERVLASPGRPLEPKLREDMERRFVHDFSRVRVHSGTEAEQSAQDVNARAYTVGQSIVFGAGKFAPGTRAAQGLLAHELAHVVQQQSGAEANVVRRSNGFEDEPTLVERQSPHLPPFRGHVERGGEKIPGNVAKGEIVEKKPPAPTSGGGGAAATFELGKVGALDAALFYLQIHAAHFAALEAVSNKVEIAKDLLSHVAEFEDGARQLRGAVNKLQKAEAALPTVWEILPTGEQAASTVSLRELEHINAYATRASNIVSEAFDAKVKLNKIINGWDAVVAQGEETRDFTRQAVVEAAQTLDLRFSSEKGGSFRAFLVAARDDAGGVETSARSKWYEAKDILDSANLP